jgi:ribosome-associated protein
MTTKTYSIEVHNIPIRLGQFLKFANIAQDGIEAKMLIQNGNIKVNGNIETRRGKQLQNLDTISYENSIWIITPEQNTK